MKKVMLLAPKDMCDVLQDALDNRYITLPCSDPVVRESVLALTPDALILSLPLPGADGLTFLRSHTDHLPPVILVLTPFINDSLLTELCELGVSSVFLIPYKMSYLVNILTELLD